MLLIRGWSIFIYKQVSIIQEFIWPSISFRICRCVCSFSYCVCVCLLRHIVFDTALFRPILRNVSKPRLLKDCLRRSHDSDTAYIIVLSQIHHPYQIAATDPITCWLKGQHNNVMSAEWKSWGQRGQVEISYQSCKWTFCSGDVGIY